MDIKPCTTEYEQYLVKLANDNLCRGIIEEPRMYWDSILVPDAGLIDLPGPTAYSSADVFKNGERFPVRITHVTMQAGYVGDRDGPVVADASEIQRVGVQMRFHDQWYMNPNFCAAPLWATQPCAAAYEIAKATASWKFERPFILGARDTMQVSVKSVVDPSGATPVTVTFTGIGIKSKRPYFFSGVQTLFDQSTQMIPSDNFRNDGAEPVLMTDMIVNCANALGSTDPVGDVRTIQIQVKCVGNGTNANWFVTPTVPVPIPNANAGNLGAYSGRAVVHRFPGDGLIWEPGEGIDIAIQRISAPQTNTTTIYFQIGLLGYIAVQ